MYVHISIYMCVYMYTSVQTLTYFLVHLCNWSTPKSYLLRSSNRLEHLACVASRTDMGIGVNELSTPMKTNNHNRRISDTLQISQIIESIVNW